jgi:hypothetical protein
MRRSFVVAGPAAFAAIVLVFAVGAIASCSRSVDPQPLRTFERAQKLDVVCMHVRDELGNVLHPPEPLPAEACTAVPRDVVGDLLPNHLFALVTQTLRGEIAVVDLTAGRITDVDHSTPGVNFLSVGSLPTDVASAPDGKISFVATAEPNKWAIYALPSAPLKGSDDSHGILGDDYGLSIPKITDWPVCALPQAPSALSILPREGPAGGYDLAVVLPGSGRAPTKVALIDPLPFLRGAKLDATPGAAIAPGSLEPCVTTTAIELTGDVPESVPVGAEWASGVPWADAGAPLPLPAGATCESASNGDGGAADAGDAGASADASASGAGEDAGTIALSKLPGDVPRAVQVARDGSLLYLADEGLPLIHVLDFKDPAAPRELDPLVATSVENPMRRVSVGRLAVSPPTREFKRFLYAIDRDDGSLMVFDVTDMARGLAPRVPMRRPHPEINPFQPSDRIGFSVPVTGVTFVHNDWPLLRDNDVPLTAAKTGLLCNPNPNANADPDRGIEQPFRDPGAYYRGNEPPGGGLEILAPYGQLGPFRLRGIFAFVTLASGQLAIVDVDDWDAPCRRPDPMGIRGGNAGTELDANGSPSPIVPPLFSAVEGGQRTRGVNDVAPLMPSPSSRDDLDPYHAPAAFYPLTSTSFTTGVSNEAFFPVSAPHRPRSLYMLRRDPTTGIHVPYLPALPVLRSAGSPINTVGPNGLRNPIMLPTYSALPDPGQVTTPTEANPRSRALARDQSVLDEAHLPIESSTADVRFSWEDPLVHVDQDWTVTFEGPLPGFDKLAATIAPIDVATADYSAAVLGVQNGLLCRRGVTDQSIAAARVQSVLETFANASTFEGEPLLSAPPRLDHKLGDYVQIVDEVVAPEDPYWSAEEPAGDACWDPSISTPAARYDLCARTFGPAAGESPYRDFPILEAYDDHLVIGHYGYENPQSPTPEKREIVGRGDPSKAPFLKLARCCFHRQAHFNVRAGAEWVAVGSVSGFLHSITRGEGGRCVASCSPDDALLNGRAAQVPRPLDIALPPPLAPNATQSEIDAHDLETARIQRRRAALRAFLDRDSPLALRTPMFALVMWNALDADQTGAPPARDLQWAFQTRGQFAPLIINLASGTSSVAPQTLRFIDSVQQLAVVDASLQGLQLFDLRTLAAVRDPYL